MAAKLQRARRRDPNAPLLVMLHEDGDDAPSGIRIGRLLWPGAPLVSLGGAYPEEAGWRHLSEPAVGPAHFAVEAHAVERIARVVLAAAEREPPLVELIGVGFGGGADAVLALLCRNPTLFAGAVLCRLRRCWSCSLQDMAKGYGVEVLIMTEAASINTAIAAESLLSLSGHRAEIRLSKREDEIAVTRAWLREQLDGES